jgi:peptidoglycan-N-acetylglucosamine deacetylase
MRAWVAGALLIGISPAIALSRAAAKPSVSVALTFDDLPSHGPLQSGETRLSIVNAIVKALKQAKVKEAYGFVAGSFGSGNPQSPLVLKAWRAAGYPLGNHSWTHANLDNVSADWFLNDIARDEAVIAPLMRGRNWHWFRYPYLAEGRDSAKRDAVRAGLTLRLYRVAAVTINFDDFAYNEPYVRCRAAGNDAGVARLEALYRAGAASTLAIARQTGGGQILLLHIGTFTAHMLPRLLEDYRDSGARFVSLAQVVEPLNSAPASSFVYTTPFAELAALCPTVGRAAPSQKQAFSGPALHWADPERF